MGGYETLPGHDEIEPVTKRSSLPARTRTILTAGLLLFAAAMAIWYLQQNPILGWDFNNNIWIPAKLLIGGQSPYRVDLLHEAGNAVWMPAIIGISAPLGWLSFPTASNLWFLVNLTALSAIIALLAARQRPPVALVAITAMMAAAFPPTITHLRLGQFTILATFLFLAVAFLKERLPLPIAALMLALALSKPQLGLLVVPGLLLAYYREDGRKRALQLLGLILLWSVVLAAPLFLGSANWIGDFVAALLKNPSWVHPSMWLLLPRHLGPIGLWLWVVIVLILGVVSLRLWFTHKREEAILWSLALTPLLTPYIWSWDFVMVLPLFASTVMASKSRLQLAILGLGYLLCWLIVWQIAASDPNNVRYWWIPWFMILLVLLARFAGKSHKKRAASLPVNIL
jgi:hypothetical protein